MTTRAGYMESLVGYTLLGGVLLSMGLVAAGLAWHWAEWGDLRFDYALPATTVAGFVATDFRQLFSEAPRPRFLMNLGLGVLMLTPYVRVLASMAYFVCVERNRKYALFTAFVLGTLTYSLFR